MHELAARIVEAHEQIDDSVYEENQVQDEQLAHLIVLQPRVDRELVRSEEDPDY